MEHEVWKCSGTIKLEIRERDGSTGLTILFKILFTGALDRGSLALM